MTKLTLNIPDNKVDFFTELVDNLGFVTIEYNAEKPILSDHQKELVRTEKLKAQQNPDYMLDWEDVQKNLHID